MPARVIHLFARVPKTTSSARTANQYTTPIASGDDLRGEEAANGLPAFPRKAAFPPVFIIELLAQDRQQALRDLLHDRFEQSFVRSDYQIQTKNLDNLGLTVWLIDCLNASILTLLDPVSGTRLQARLCRGDLPDLQSLLRYLARLVPHPSENQG